MEGLKTAASELTSLGRPVSFRTMRLSAMSEPMVPLRALDVSE